MTQKDDPEGKNFTFAATYDPLGRRLSTTYSRVGENVVDQSFVYDPEVEFREMGVSESTHGLWTGNEVFWKIYHGHTLEAVHYAESGEHITLINNIHGDSLGKISAAKGCWWNCDTKEQWFKNEPSPYGKLKGPAQKHQTYRGKTYDPTGLIYMGTRYYDPGFGQFLSPDPVGYTSSVSLYAYADGDPINFFDPTGRLAQKSWEAVKPTVHQAMEWGKMALYASWNNPVSDFTVGMFTNDNSMRFDMPNGDTMNMKFVMPAAGVVRAAKTGIQIGGTTLERLRSFSSTSFKTNSNFGTYDGVREASRYLKNMQVGRAERVRILQSFDPSTVNLRTAGNSDFVMRFHDNGKTAKPLGQYFFKTINDLTNRRNLALPYEFNQMTGVKQWQIVPGSRFIEGRTASQLEYGSQYIGGAKQIFVLKPWAYNSIK